MKSETAAGVAKIAFLLLIVGGLPVGQTMTSRQLCRSQISQGIKDRVTHAAVEYVLSATRREDVK